MPRSLPIMMMLLSAIQHAKLLSIRHRRLLLIREKLSGRNSKLLPTTTTLPSVMMHARPSSKLTSSNGRKKFTKPVPRIPKPSTAKMPLRSRRLLRRKELKQELKEMSPTTLRLKMPEPHSIKLN